jgi:hypothetical protein
VNLEYVNGFMVIDGVRILKATPPLCGMCKGPLGVASVKVDWQRVIGGTSEDIQSVCKDCWEKVGPRARAKAPERAYQTRGEKRTLSATPKKRPDLWE